MDIDVERLDKLAWLRNVPQILERLWEKKNRINPVVQAMRYEKELARIKKTILLSTASLFISVSSFVTIFLLSGAQQEEFRVLAAIMLIFLFFCSLASFLVVVVTLFDGFYAKSYGEKDQAEAYGIALGKFVSWSGKHICDFCTSDMSVNKLKQEARRILIQDARKVLEFESKSKSEEVDERDLDFLSTQTEMVDEMKHKAATLLSLSLRNDTDLRQYFKAAQAELDADAEAAAA